MSGCTGMCTLFFVAYGYYNLQVKILAVLKIVDLAGINFSDFTITCSIFFEKV